MVAETINVEFLFKSFELLGKDIKRIVLLK